MVYKRFNYKLIKWYLSKYINKVSKNVLMTMSWLVNLYIQMKFWKNWILYSIVQLNEHPQTMNECLTYLEFIGNFHKTFNKAKNSKFMNWHKLSLWIFNIFDRRDIYHKLLFVFIFCFICVILVIDWFLLINSCFVMHELLHIQSKMY